VTLWIAETGQEILTLEADEFNGRSVAFSPDGKRVVASGEDRLGERLARVRDALTGRRFWS